MVVTGAILLVIASAMGLGGVYPWVYIPLSFGCAAIGIVGLAVGRRIRRIDRALTITIATLLAAIGIQLVPLPARLLSVISPATDRFLRDHELSYVADGARHPLSIDPDATSLALLFVAGCALFFIGLVRTLTTSRVHRVATAITVFGVGLALFGMIQKAVLGDDVYAGMRVYGFWEAGRMAKPYGPFINRNNFAAWMMLAIPMVLGFALAAGERGLERADGSWRRFVTWLSTPEGGRLQLLIVAVAMMSASLLLTKSRSGVGGLAIALALAALVMRKRIWRGSLRWVVVAVGVVLAIVTIWAGGDLLAKIQERPYAPDIRPVIWSRTIEVIRAFPVAGTGLHTYGIAMLQYQRTHPTLHFNAAHNEYLELAAEGGLLLLIPALVLTILITRRIRRRFAAGRDDRDTYWLRAGAVTGLVAVGLQSLVEFPLQMPGVFVLVVVTAAIAMYEPREASAAHTAK